MKAQRFIREHGWLVAKDLVAAAGKEAKTIAYQMRDADTPIHVNNRTLTKLVNSWQLLEDFFNINSLGVEKALTSAKAEMEELQNRGVSLFYHRYSDEGCTVKRMMKAIHDVATC